MKSILLKNIIIVDPTSEWNGQKTSILIENGHITDINNEITIPSDTEIVEGANFYLSRGWVDLRANFCDPGFEYKEDIASGMETAAYGGFTGVAILPETEPILSSKSSIEYIISKAAGKIVDLYPLASVTSDKGQENLTEMYDAKDAGAMGFSSGYSPINNNGFLLRAMEYAGMTGLPLMVRPENKSISGKGMVNEGIMSVKLGLKGSPVIAEVTEINTVISLCEYTNKPIHFSCVSTREGLLAIEKAYETGLPVSADISIQHLCFSEEDVQMFDTNLKLKPPLRTKEDRKYLQDVVLRNKFISIVSDHNPHEEDKKRCEFELADYGAIGLQTLFSQMISIYGIKKLDNIIEILTLRPRKVLDLPYLPITIGSIANFTIFDPQKSWLYNDDSNKSKSRNSPVWNTKMAGKAVAIINNGQIKILK